MTMLVQSTLQRNNGQMALLVPGAATRKPGIFLILDDQVFYKDNGVKDNGVRSSFLTNNLVKGYKIRYHLSRI